MKIVVAVIVYDRFKNIEEWVRCWKLCNTENAELVIIHNFKNNEDKLKYKEFCNLNNIAYICRNNIGMDIGALQDVCRERLEGFPKEWDYLLWVTDDTIPMSKDFISHYLRKKPDIGIVALELSNEHKLHIRTTGFMLRNEIMKLIQFPVDPILTKDHCYHFEHRGHDAFYEQMIQLGQVVKVNPSLKDSCLWDTDCRARLNRWEEHYKEFPK